MDVVKKQVSTLLTLPKKANEFLTKANKGELEIEVKDLEKSTKKLYAGSQQIGFVIIVVSTYNSARFGGVRLQRPAGNLQAAQRTD